MIRPVGRFFVLYKNIIMAITKDKKKNLVEDIDKSLSGSKSVVFVKFDKLRVADSDTFRRDMRNAGVGYTVTKKTLLKRALESQKIEGEMPEMEGQIAIAYSEDDLASAREVYNFHKGHKDNVQIVGGIFEGKYKNAIEMMSIATIPSREVLLSQIAYLLKSPIQRLAIGINEVAKTKTA